MKILVVGAVAAGPKTASRIKRLMPNAEVTMIDQERFISYGGCGIPYYLSGEVENERELRATSFGLLRDEAFFLAAKGVQVLTETRALALDRKRKTVETLHLPTGQRESIGYDKLVLATGSVPVTLPIPGRDLQGVYAFATLEKAIDLKRDLTRGRVSRAVIIGGGAIGIETAEALADLWGIPVTLVELMPQLLPGLASPVLVGMLAAHLKHKGVEIRTGESVLSLEGDKQGRVARVITDKGILEADLVVMAVGVRPHTELAREAGLALAANGAIIVDERMRTTDPDIYAAGDCVAVKHLVTGRLAYAPLGSLANRQGRVAADNIAGLASKFPGYAGSFILRAFSLSLGATGISREAALREGFATEEAICAQTDRAHFFPGSAMMFFSLIMEKKSRRVLGVQGIAKAGDALLARINAAAGLIAQGGLIEDFCNLEMAYAPPFAQAVDVLNSTAFVADNIAAGRYRVMDPLQFASLMESPGAEDLVVDLRSPGEAAPFLKSFPDRWICLPYEKVREDWQKLPSGRRLILLCNSSTRSYEVQCFLDSVGLVESIVPAGGANVLRRLHLSWWPHEEE